MSDPFIEPGGHKKPYRRGLILAPGLFEPRDRRFMWALFYAMCVLMGMFMAVLPGGGWKWALGYLVGGIPVSWLCIRFMLWMRRRWDPEAGLLAESEEGRILLQEGEGLHKRRERITEDRNSPHPISADVHAAAWQEQIRLERDLRGRQDRLLSDA